VQRPGEYEAVWDGRDLRGRPVGSGPYFVHLRTGGATAVRKLLLLK
jgi:hypothetical protein